MNHQRFIWPVGVDAHSAVVVHRVGKLAPLPQDLAITLKLPWVGCLEQEKRRTGVQKDRGTVQTERPLGRQAKTCR